MKYPRAKPTTSKPTTIDRACFFSSASQRLDPRQGALERRDDRLERRLDRELRLDRRLEPMDWNHISCK
jgi:hypothetical protein